MLTKPISNPFLFYIIHFSLSVYIISLFLSLFHMCISFLPPFFQPFYLSSLTLSLFFYSLHAESLREANDRSAMLDRLNLQLRENLCSNYEISFNKSKENEQLLAKLAKDANFAASLSAEHRIREFEGLIKTRELEINVLSPSLVLFFSLS